MAGGVSISGLEELEQRLHATSAGLADLSEPNRAAARIALESSTPHTPRRSGELAAHNGISVSRDGWALTNSTGYALFVHWGTRHMRRRPWLDAGAKATEDQWTDEYRRFIQSKLDG